MVKSGKLKLADDAPAAPVEEDDTALIDRKELKRREAALAQQVAGAIQHQTQQVASLALENTIENHRGKLKNFDKYEGEIRGLLSRMDPQVAARADTLRKVHKVVAAEHAEEEYRDVEAAAIAKEHERLRAAGVEIPDEEGADETTTPSGRIAGSIPSSGRTGVAALGDGAGSRMASRSRDVSVKPLSREERIASQLITGSVMSAEEYRRYADPNWKPDLLGSKGRQKF